MYNWILFSIKNVRWKTKQYYITKINIWQYLSLFSRCRLTSGKVFSKNSLFFASFAFLFVLDSILSHFLIHSCINLLYVADNWLFLETKYNLLQCSKSMWVIIPVEQGSYLACLSACFFLKYSNKRFLNITFRRIFSWITVVSVGWL